MQWGQVSEGWTCSWGYVNPTSRSTKEHRMSRRVQQWARRQSQNPAGDPGFPQREVKGPGRMRRTSIEATGDVHFGSPLLSGKFCTLPMKQEQQDRVVARLRELRK